MSKSFLKRHRREYVLASLLAAGSAWMFAPACSSPGTGSTGPGVGFGGTPGVGAGGTVPAGGSSVGGNVSDGGVAPVGGAPPAGGTPGVGAAGGTVPAGGTAGTISLGGFGGVGGGLDPGLPIYEQDDPNLIPPESAYQRVAFPAQAARIMALDIDKDERVYVLERAGRLSIWDSENNGGVTVAGTIPCFDGNEDGALALTLDPDFENNGWVYIYYSANGTTGNNVGESVLSRFTITADVLDLDSEQVLLRIPDERTVQWHVAGGMDVDADGNLYLSTGDNTNPFESGGYSPHDERNGRALYDAQRSASNTQDPRGKILRIHPEADGTYTIPAGNLFTDPNDGLPEIYIMGNRNPFRIAVDHATGWLYWGEVGPDGNSNSNAGPLGYDEFNQAKAAGNYGWPYCIADNQAYAHSNFAGCVNGDCNINNSAYSGSFDCDAPVNNSPNNTGANNLPAAQPAWIFYSYTASNPWTNLVGGGNARTGMMGDVYNWKQGGSINKFPRYYDGSKFVLEYSRQFLAEVRTDADGAVQSVEKIFTGMDWDHPIHMRFSPNGVMYVVAYGNDTNGTGTAAYRVNYLGNNNKPPTAVASSDVDSGPTPLTVQFSSAGSSDAENDPLTYEWDFQGDAVVDSTEANPSFTYTAPGPYKVSLLVSDGTNKGLSTLNITAGNTRPVVTFTSPPSGAFVGQGETVNYTIAVTDAEDGSTQSGIDCASVMMLAALGHDSHQHDGSPVAGCTGSATTATGIIPSEDAWQILQGSYADSYPAGVQLVGTARANLHFKKKEMEHFHNLGEASEGIDTEETTDTGGGFNVAYIDDGSYICWNEMNFMNITGVNYRYASDGTGGRVEIHQDSPTGPMVSSTAIPTTGDWQAWQTASGTINDTTGGTHKTCFVFKNNAGDTLLFNLNWMEFVGAGVSQ